MMLSAGDSASRTEKHILVFSVTVVSALEESDSKSIRVKRDSIGASGSLSHQAPFPCTIANAIEFLSMVTLPSQQ